MKIWLWESITVLSRESQKSKNEVSPSIFKLGRALDILTSSLLLITFVLARKLDTFDRWRGLDANKPRTPVHKLLGTFCLAPVSAEGLTVGPLKTSKDKTPSCQESMGGFKLETDCQSVFKISGVHTLKRMAVIGRNFEYVPLNLWEKLKSAKSPFSTFSYKNSVKIDISMDRACRFVE